MFKILFVLMAAGLIYEMQFKNVEDVLVRVLIGDTSVPESDNPVIKQLQPGGTPLLLSTIDNEEKKFNQIRSQQATVTFLSDEDNSLDNFSDGPDDRFNVTVYYGAQVIFYGFISLNDNQEAFVAGSNEVTLTANDKLAALKDIPLTDFNEDNPEGKHTIAKFIAWCLQKTGLELKTNVVNNLRHGTGQLTTLATFQNSPIDQIIVSNTAGEFFYANQRVQITGTSSNNIEFTVLDVGIGIVTLVASSEDFTPESEVNATFTDITGDGHIYNTTYLDAKTFEEEIGESENCYDVLKKILGYDSFLIQHKGTWWIMRIDEFDTNPFYVTVFDENGDLESSYVENTFMKNIGFIQTQWLSDEATVVSPQRPIKFAKLIYNFNYPLETICNELYERGDFIEDMDSEVNEDGVTEQVKKYELDCWDFEARIGASNVWNNYEQSPPAGSEAYVKRFYFHDEEKRRELVIKSPSGTGNGAPYVISQPIPVTLKDILNFSVSLYYTNIGGSTGYLNSPVMIGLFGKSGNIYWWEAGDITDPSKKQVWNETAPNLVIPHWYLGASLEDDPADLSFESPPVPESGNIVIILINQYGNEIQAHFGQPDLQIYPFVNGAYRFYKGRHNKVEREAAGYLAKLEDEVFISDADRELFKGAMFLLEDGNYILSSRWYPSHKYALGYPTDLTDIRPFGEHQAYAVWNQYRLANRVFQMQSQGFGSDIPHPVHKFAITDFSPHSINRYFLMITFEKDLFLCNMTATIEQVYHLTEGKSYDDPHEFKYIS